MGADKKFFWWAQVLYSTWDESQSSADEPDECRADKGRAEVESSFTERMRNADKALDRHERQQQKRYLMKLKNANFHPSKEARDCSYDLWCGDGQDSYGRALPGLHPLLGVLIVLAAEADVPLADANQVDPDAHVGG